MANKYLIIDQMRVNFDGIYDLQLLLKRIQRFFFERGYDYNERKSTEVLTETGKSIRIDMRPWRKFTDYAKVSFRIRITTDVADINIEKAGQNLVLKKGKLFIVIEAFLQTDWGNQWGKSPLVFFLNIIFDKILFKRYTDKFTALVMDETNSLRADMKSILNMYQYEGKFAPRWG